jgi:AraC-like DNA-binding protein
MSRSATFTFDDPIPYQAAIRGGEVDVLVTAKGKFHATLTQIDCDRLWMQFADEKLPRLTHSALDPKRTFIAFLADPSQPAAQYCGREVSSSAIVLGAPGSSRHIRTRESCRWASMSFPADDFAAASSALVGRELHAASGTRLVCPDPAHMARLVRLHRAARQLAESAPEIFLRTEVSGALEHELVQAMATCLADNDQVEDAPGRRHHSAIMRRFEELLAANCDRPLHLLEICAAIGASERTLRIVCEEHLGMGPVRYLWLRRIHLARGALIRADPAKTTVTEIATRFGFWQLGRFAVAYRALFGESPSASLHRPPNGGRALQKKNAPRHSQIPKLNSHHVGQPQYCTVFRVRSATLGPNLDRQLQEAPDRALAPARASQTSNS